MKISATFISLVLILNIASASDPNHSRIKEFNDVYPKHYREKLYDDLNIDVWENVTIETSINLNTGILTGKYKDEPSFSFPIINVKTPDHLGDVELIFAAPTFDFDEVSNKITGYVYVALISESTNPRSSGRGQCGAGVEVNLDFIYLDKNGKLVSKDRYLLNSCFQFFPASFISTVNFRDILASYTDTKNIMHYIYFDTRHPEKGVFESAAPIIYNNEKLKK